MQIVRLPHYFKKAIELGPRVSFIVVKNRLHDAWHDRRVRRSALQRTASHVWEDIKPYSSNRSFTEFWIQQREKTYSFLERLYELSQEELFQQADAFEQKNFDLLGSGLLKFSSIPWHSDFRLHAQNSAADHVFDNNVFYKDIMVASGEDGLVKDIKVPWELSRCQHLFVMGQAYRKTHDEKYAHAFVEHVSDWIRQNPYLLGVNWACPMDVGIRALNWLCAFHFFKESVSISDTFWQKLICSLYDHAIYLENNWEIYDGRTSNHYLSDLVGYFYLCYFFRDLTGFEDKLQWCKREISREMEKQVLDDGSDYEGSTSYHGLVTELFLHASYIAQEAGIPFEKNYEEKVQRMLVFAAWTDGLHIGDHDSGKILYYGLPSTHVKSVPMQESSKLFPHFGLMCFRSDRLSGSFRVHAYTKRQPSGHFHNDVGSITLKVDGVPVIVDPGSYVYTPSSVWRNYFRSAHQHSTFFLQSREAIPVDEHLFSLSIPEQRVRDMNEMHLKHTLYSGVVAHRHVSCSDERVTIVDWWQGSEAALYPTEWNFIVAPWIEVSLQAKGFVFKHNGKPIAQFFSSLHFVVKESWFSPEYGSKVPCKKLQAKATLNSGDQSSVVMQACESS